MPTLPGITVATLTLAVLTLTTLALTGCGGTTSNALRSNDGIPIYSFGGEGGQSSVPC